PRRRSSGAGRSAGVKGISTSPVCCIISRSTPCPGRPPMSSINQSSVRRWLIPLALLAGASAAASSCGDPSPVGVETRLAAQKVGAGRLLSCPPAAYDSVTQVIGPAGGLLVVGSHVLVVDSLALSSPVGITAVGPSQSVNMVRLRPEGLKFK